MKKYYQIPLLLACCTSAMAQEPQFTQFYSAPMYLNPAFTGLTTEHRFSASYRNQWPGIKNGFSTYMAAYDYNADKLNTGIGGFVLQDKAGTSNLVSTCGGLNFSYRIKTGKASEVRAGLLAAMGQKKIDNSGLVFNDQFITGAAMSEDVKEINSVSYFDMGFGALYNTPKMWAGFTAKHLNRPNVSMTGNSQALPVYMSVHGGYRFILDSTGTKTSQSLNIALHYRHESANDQVDIGANYFYKFMNAGIWYRGLPLKTFNKGYTNHESVALLIGMEIPDKGLNIGYSYDFTVSGLVFKNTMGAHEVTLIYQLGKNKKSPSGKASIRQKF